ncbi:hypothetical protein OAQ35_05080 [Litorivicinus sp.]|nr:hypothetical protein [Litorivicinus sp.]
MSLLPLVRSDDALKASIIATDKYLAEKGFGAFPMPPKWAAFYSWLKGQISQPDIKKSDPGLPLILAAWHYSNGYEKRERFIKQIIWGQSAGLRQEIENWLRQLSPEEWVEYGSKPFLKEIDEPIYYVTGRMGSMSHGFGANLASMGRPYAGRELGADFFRMRHEEQVDTILADLNEFNNSPIVANSYGAFLILCALTSEPIALSHCLFISPVTGATFVSGRYFRPAGARQVESSIRESNFRGRIDSLNLLVGELGEQAVPERCLKLAEAFGGKAFVIPGVGHKIDPDIVGSKFANFLNQI